MNLSVESVNYRLSAKIDCLSSYLSHVKGVVKGYFATNPPLGGGVRIKKKMSFVEYLALDVKSYELSRTEKNIDNLICFVERIKLNYNNCVTRIFSEYYLLIDSPEEKDRNRIRELTESYYNVLSSENFVDQLDSSLDQVLQLVNELEKAKSFREFTKGKQYELKQDVKPITGTFSEITAKCEELYAEYKLVFPTKTNPVGECKCGGKMTIHPELSESCCQSCGMMTSLSGTVFDDSQFYNQQGQFSKTKKYDFNKHCVKTLYQVQAKDQTIFPPGIIDLLDQKAVREYTKNGILRNMEDMSCRKIRLWLKESGLNLAKLNPNAPLIRKIITSNHGKAVVPPQLTTEEEEIILSDFSRAMAIYENLIKDPEFIKTISSILGKKKFKNKPLYQFVLYKIFSCRLRGDPRLPGLVDCIHFQSQATINKNDLFWKYTCPKMPLGNNGEVIYIYEPTDRSALSRNF